MDQQQRRFYSRQVQIALVMLNHASSLHSDMRCVLKLSQIRRSTAIYSPKAFLIWLN